jgi:tetratricopeptide (TPR) repeat protein
MAWSRAENVSFLNGCLILLLGISAAAQSAPAQRSPSRLLEEANSHYRALRSAEAVRLYREYLAYYPDRADVRTYLGAALLNMQEPREALEEANRAIKLDDRYAKAYTLAGRIYTEQQQWELSKQCFEQAVLLDPGDRETWYFFGRSSYEANRFEQAIESYLRALKLGAGQSRLYENLGLAYEALGQSGDAEKAYRRAVELPETTYRSYVAYGMFLFKQGRMTESLRLLEQAFRMEPNVDVRFALGRVLYHAGKLTEASQVLEGALPSDECRLHNLLAKVFAIQGKHSEAETEVKFLANCRGETSSR